MRRMGKARGEHYLILYMMFRAGLCEQGRFKQILMKEKGGNYADNWRERTTQVNSSRAGEGESYNGRAPLSGKELRKTL